MLLLRDHMMEWRIERKTLIFSDTDPHIHQRGAQRDRMLRFHVHTWRVATIARRRQVTGLLAGKTADDDQRRIIRPVPELTKSGHQAFAIQSQIIHATRIRRGAMIFKRDAFRCR